MNNFLPPHAVNPISGCTRDEEIEKARAIGGRLPFDAYENLILRGVVPYPKGNRRKKNNARRRAGRKEYKKYGN
ncbi:MAG: hypothetical protein IKZ53_03385 [Selenomonadaceae bacterium]|nr:hypothetical protein [Selenomonadaceae bacterium]